MMRTGKIITFLAMFTLTLFMTGCAGNSISSTPVDKQNNQMTQNSSEQQKNAGLSEQGTNGTAKETMKITVYHATKDALYLVPEVHIVPKQALYAQTALELLIAGTANKDLVAVMPQGTKVRGVTIKNHVAYADFSDALIKNHGGGSATEQLIVAAIVNTLTEFPDIQKVQIFVDGKKIDTISGHLDTSEPFSRFERMIKKST